MSDRFILCMYSQGYYEAALEFLPMALRTGAGLELRDHIDLSDKEKYTDVVTIGFSLSPEIIEQLYMDGKKQILSIDTYYDSHPLRVMDVSKMTMPFLEHRGKWAILVGTEDWYRQVVKELVNVR